jgi:hypothetical protein
MARDTVKIPALRRRDAIKIWIPVITASISLIGTISVAIVQTYSATAVETSIIMKNLDVVIKNIKEIQGYTNTKVLPTLQTAIGSCKEKIANLEGKLEVLLQKRRVHHNVTVPKTLFDKMLGKTTAEWLTKTITKPKMFEIPKLQLQQQVQQPEE